MSYCSRHLPVMTEEVLEYLAPQKERWFVDTTLGGGGHTKVLLDSGAKVVAIDQDPQAIQRAQKLKKKYRGRLYLIHGRFENLTELLKTHKAHITGKIYGILFDLGLSSDQLADAERGFSYQIDAPLDMRMDLRQEVTAADLINGLAVDKLQKLFSKYGELPRAKRLAKQIARERERNKIKTTRDLSRIVDSVYDRGWKRKIPAVALVFQALRIAVNDEINQLRVGLRRAVEVLAVGGRLVVLSFHSLEDRKVKRFMRTGEQLRVLTKKPVFPKESEIADNPRVSAAKLRAAEKIF